MQLASTTICMHHLREIGHSLTLYRVENDGWLPTERVAPPPPLAGARRTRAAHGGTGKASVPDVWFLKLYPTYLDDPAALTCPEDPFRYRMLQARRDSSNPAISNYASYGISSFIMNAADGALANLDRRQPTRPLDTILIADLGPDNTMDVSDIGSTKDSGPSRNKGLLVWDDSYDPLSPLPPKPPWITVRHGEGINVLTIAGGVRPARTLDMMRKPMLRYYRECAAGGCSLCGARSFEDQLFHYSFARDRLYWWTGPVIGE